MRAEEADKLRIQWCCAEAGKECSKQEARQLAKVITILSYAPQSRNKMSCWRNELSLCSIFSKVPIQDPGSQKLNHLLRIFPREFKDFIVWEPDL